MRGRSGRGRGKRGEMRDPRAMVLLVMFIDLVRQFLFFFLFNNGTRVLATNTNETS
jgi:hypothetical protein